MSRLVAGLALKASRDRWDICRTSTRGHGTQKYTNAYIMNKMCPICVRGLAIVSVSVSASVFPTVAESLKAFQYRHTPPLLPTPWFLSFPVMSRSGQAPWCVCKWRDHSSLKQPPPRTCSRKAGRRLGVCTAYPPHGFFPP